ncbi:hypothetical protein NQ314_004817 [Rhamnusium bicolor]|uniref:Uncharacterized protein n=1 Tax=Rhamnusium bicolor TaxID=1586634 RepID=A0AAV8ZJX7_9CUCU|nr:hypothetical protein NQ314_004817 [Rhamnusium bicolor]
MSDDSNSEELEDLDDDDDDEDEDEEEDEEESLEETTSSEKTEDINSLHNLPPGVKLSPYNLELDQSIKENVEKENIALKENIVVQQKPNSEVSSPVVSLESNNNIPLVPEHIQVNSRPEVKQTSEDKTSSNLDTLQSEKNEEIKREIDDKIVSNTAKMETATETTFVEEEPLPILDIITPNPIEVKIEEKPKTEDIPIVENSLPETAPPQENLTLNKNKNQQADSVPSPIDTIKTGLTNTSVEEQLGLKPQSQVELVQVSGSVAENNLIENPIHKEDEKLSTNSPPPPLLGGLFNKAQNLNLNENTEKAKVGIPVEQSLKVDNSKEVEGSSNEVLKYNLANKEKIVEEPSIQVNHLNDFSKQESTSEEKLVNNLKEESNDIKENLVSEEKTGNVLRDELINQSDLINDVSKQEPTSEKQIVNVSKEESANQEQILSDEDSKEIFLDPKDEIVTGILKDVANELTNEEHVVSKENIDEDYDSKEGTEENKPLEGEEYSNDNIIRDERKAVYDDINGEVLNDYGGNLEEPSNSVKESDGFISGLFSFFGSDTTDKTAPNTDPPFSSGEEVSNKIETTLEDSVWSSKHIIEPGHCDTDAEVCKTRHQILSEEKELLEKLELNFNSDIFLYLITTAISVILFLFGYMALDRNRREAPLVAIINKLEKQLLITLKENEILQENSSSSFVQEIEGAPNEFVEQLAQRLAEVELMKQALEGRVTELEKELEDKEALVEQIENLEKELETSTEVGMELNRIISEMLDPTNGSERLKENVEQLQRQLLEQKDTISSINESLRDKEAENTTLHVELERNKKKVIELQNKLDDMAQRILKIEKEKRPATKHFTE